MLILFKIGRLKGFRTRVGRGGGGGGKKKGFGNRGWVYTFRIMIVLKLLALGGF